MITKFWQTSVEFLKGIGPERAKILKEQLGIETYYDLFRHFPYRYVDRSKFYRTNEIRDLNYDVQLKGKITSFETSGPRNALRLQDRKSTRLNSSHRT